MKVELLSCTQDALELLLFTKNTRLQGAQSLQDIKEWPDEKKKEHFEYMLDTIQSSFEFVEYTFKISEVPRSFTHQLVRTRTGSYAQESQRTVDVRGHGCDWPETNGHFDGLRDHIFEAYASMVDEDIPVQEAREILPTGTHTSIIAKFDLRTLHNMALVRLCTRTAGVYQDVFREIKRLVIGQHPWAEEFIQVHCSWYGTCAFPRYEECPIQEHTINRLLPTTLMESKANCRKAIEETTHVANPIAKDGMSMASENHCWQCDHFRTDECPHYLTSDEMKICSRFEDGIPL